jgi:hypothetical protein
MNSGYLTAARAKTSYAARDVSRGDFDCVESLNRVVAGPVPATPIAEAQSNSNRGGRDKPGHDQEPLPEHMNGVQYL